MLHKYLLFVVVAFFFVGRLLLFKYRFSVGRHNLNTVPLQISTTTTNPIREIDDYVQHTK